MTSLAFALKSILLKANRDYDTSQPRGTGCDETSPFQHMQFPTFFLIKTPMFMVYAAKWPKKYIDFNHRAICRPSLCLSQ